MSQSLFEFDAVTKERVTGQAERTLELLRRRSMNTLELQEAVGPRPAAYVGALKDRGYLIDVERDGDVAAYIYRGYTPRLKVTDEMQARYYETPHWSERRRERFAIDSWKCCHCKRVEDLQVHHWHYDLFNEDIEDLVTLCRNCHVRIHEYANVRIHFPRWVSPDIAARLESTP